MSDPVYLLVGFMLGGGAGYWLHARFMRGQPSNRIYEVRLDANNSLRLREFGRLDIDRARALASRIVHGTPIRYRSMVGKGKLLRRSEWDAIITGEWRRRGFVVKGTDKIYRPSPACVDFCGKLLPPRARTANH